jgi:hypothetical protein
MKDLLLRRLDLESVRSGELQYASAHVRARAAHARDLGHSGTAWILEGLALVVDEERDRRQAEAGRAAS